MSSIIDRDFEAVGNLEGVLSNGFIFEAIWCAPLRTVDASFGHSFGVHEEMSAETYQIRSEQIELVEVEVWPDESQDPLSEAGREHYLREIREQCLEAYQAEEFKEVET